MKEPSKHPLSIEIPLSDPNVILDRFLEVMAERGIELYEEQEEAILELADGRSVVLNTPTGSGKSLVAAALHYQLLCQGKRSVYTCPIKALVNEKFLSLCRDFGPENVGMMTGDASVNKDAPILCCTAEILANIALNEGEECSFAGVIMDEFHYYGDADRGVAWQIPLLTLPQAQFLLMSATLSETVEYERVLTRLTGIEAVTVKSDRRPVPLDFSYSDVPISEQVEGLLESNKAPVYLVHFTQRSTAETAQGLMSLKVTTPVERAVLDEILSETRFNSPYGKEMKRWLRHGIGVHHAGLLPKYRLLVESLAQKGLLKVICGTDTLGVGINVPIRTVVFTQLWKYDGRKAGTLTVRDFRQVSGRAGRRGFDDIGYVVAQAPEHVIENKRAEAKAASGNKKKKVVKKRAPDGVPGWDEKTYERLQTAPTETLQSSFQVSHGMLLQVLSREGDGCKAMRDLIRDCHETDMKKGLHRKRAWQLFRALLDREIITIIPPTPTGQKLKVNVDLQADFSLHQALSVYLLDTIPLLDQESEGYPYDLLSLCESIVEDPDAILRKQVDRLKGDMIAALKAEGVPYEERMERLVDVEHPKPLRDFIYETFNEFKAAHPWVGDENVKPKSIVREMYERYFSFAEYTKEYGLERSEGLVLRHVSQVWKVLVQTVPDGFKSDAVWEMETYLSELIRGVDSSLLDEWEKMRNPDFVESTDEEGPKRPQIYDLTRDTIAFTRLIRNIVFRFLKSIQIEDLEDALDCLDEETRPSIGELENHFEAYYEEHEAIRLDPEGRSTKFMKVEKEQEKGFWIIEQTLVDESGDHDWEVRFKVKLEASKAKEAVMLELVEVRPIA